MAKKKKPEEHVNLERYLVSYADFMTLLFATFVVLYALSQVDISQYTKLQDSLKQAFAAPSLLQGSQGVLNDGSSIFDGGSTDSMVPPILEYVSAKYEQDSFDQIQQEVNDMHKKGELNDVNVSVDERGLVIKFNDISVLFNPGSSQLTGNASSKLSQIGSLLCKKFATHMIRVEGHTDNQPVASSQYPSNWELSSARASTIVRYLIKNYKFRADRFSAIGYADTRPVASNKTAQGRAKNRRVEIVVLRNKFMSTEAGAKGLMDMKKGAGSAAIPANTPAAKKQQAEAIKKLQQMDRSMNMSPAAKDLMKQQHINSKNVVILNDTYDQESKRIENELGKMEQQNNQKIYGQGNESAPVEKVKPRASFKSDQSLPVKNSNVDPKTPEQNKKGSSVEKKPLKKQATKALPPHKESLSKLLKRTLFGNSKK